MEYKKNKIKTHKSAYCSLWTIFPLCFRPTQLVFGKCENRKTSNHLFRENGNSNFPISLTRAHTVCSYRKLPRISPLNGRHSYNHLTEPVTLETLCAAQVLIRAVHWRRHHSIRLCCRRHCPNNDKCIRASTENKLHNLWLHCQVTTNSPPTKSETTHMSNVHSART